MLIVDALSVSESLYEELKTGWLEDFAKPGATTVSRAGSPRPKATERKLMATCRVSQCITLGPSRGEAVSDISRVDIYSVLMQTKQWRFLIAIRSVNLGFLTSLACRISLCALHRRLLRLTLV